MCEDAFDCGGVDLGVDFEEVLCGEPVRVEVFACGVEGV